MDIDSLLKAFDSIYVIISPTAKTSPEFPLRGYAGPSGRLDVVARAVAALFSLLRFENDCVIPILLGPPNPPKTLVIRRNCINGIPSERAIMNLLRLLLLKGSYRECLALNYDVERVLFSIKKNKFKVIYLSENGDDLEDHLDMIISRKVAFILGSHIDIPQSLEKQITKVTDKIIRVERKSLLTSHVILFISYLRLLKNQGLLT
jgi:tRNA (pseudouridine54-N1)-methyltransferase